MSNPRPAPEHLQPPPVPMRALPLDYVRLPGVRRPGIVNTIGVMSIVVASLSLLANLYYGSQASMMLVFAKRSPTAATPLGTTTVTTSTTTTATATGTIYEVTSSVTVAPADPDAPMNPIRGMPKAQRDLVVAALADVRMLDAAQRVKLDALLAECGRDVFPFDVDAITPALVKANVSDHGILPAKTTNAGAAYFVVGNGRIDVSGTEAAFIPRDGSDVVTTSTPNALPSPAATQPAFVGTTLGRFSPLPPALMLIEVIGSALLAIYLLVIGILVLRGSPRGARLHWLYVWLKIPLAIVAGIAFAWMLGQFFVLMPTGAAPPITWFLAIYAAVIAASGLAYPIALLFALRSRRVRDYYACVTARVES